MSALPVTGFMTGPTFVCPVDGCEFVHTPRLQPTYDTTALDQIMGGGPGMMAGIAERRYREDLERTIAQHLAKHTSIEWLITLVRLMKLTGQPGPLVGEGVER